MNSYSKYINYSNPVTTAAPINKRDAVPTADNLPAPDRLYKLNPRHITIWLLGLLGLQLLLWFILPSLLRHSPTHDTLEGIAWGQQWQLGYDKHPPLAAWLSAAITHLMHNKIGWPVYLLAQISVGISFFCSWKLARLVLSPASAAIAVLLLLGCIFYGVNSNNFTPDSIQTPIWAAMMWVGAIACFQKKPQAWLCLGLLAAVAIWSKYQAPIMLATICIASCLTRETRQQWRTPWPYWGGVLAILMCLPHFIWSYQDGFPELHYALHQTQTNETSSLFGSISWPWLRFLLEQLGALSGSILLAIFLLCLRPSRQKYTQNTAWARYYPYITCVALGPLLLSLLYSIFTGGELIHRWGTPYYSALGIWLMMTWRPQFSKPQLQKFSYAIISCIFLMATGRYVAMYWLPKTFHAARSDMFFPGKEMASRLDSIWQQHQATKLRYVIAPHYLAATLADFASDQPQPYMDASPQQSPWINLAKLKQHGAMLAWRAVNMAQAKQIPAALAHGLQHIKWAGSSSFWIPYPHSNQHVIIGYAYLAPQH